MYVEHKQFLHILRAVLQALIKGVSPMIGPTCEARPLCESPENYSKSMLVFSMEQGYTHLEISYESKSPRHCTKELKIKSLIQRQVADFVHCGAGTGRSGRSGRVGKGD